MKPLIVCTAVALLISVMALRLAHSAGDLSKQTPIEVRVELGTPDGAHRFVPNEISFETGKLYKLVLTNPSKVKHYFTSPGLASRIFTRKIQVMNQNGTAAEIKGSIREIEVYPNGEVEWWFVPVATGVADDLHCHIRDDSGVTHAEQGMTGVVIIK